MSPASASQAPGTVAGIVLMFTLVPAVGHFVLIGWVALYRLTDARCREIQTELERRQAQGTSASEVDG